MYRVYNMYVCIEDNCFITHKKPTELMHNYRVPAMLSLLFFLTTPHFMLTSLRNEHAHDKCTHAENCVICAHTENLTSYIQHVHTNTARARRNKVDKRRAEKCTAAGFRCVCSWPGPLARVSVGLCAPRVCTTYI